MNRLYYRPGPALSMLVLGLCVSCAALDPFWLSKQVSVHQDVVYSRGQSGNDQQLDLFLPKGRTPFPLLIFVHGGWWQNQSRRYYRPFVGLYWNVGLALAARGVGVAVIDYRTYPEGRIEQQMQDVRAAVTWAKRHATSYGGDPASIYVAGHSAGGHLAALVGATLGKDIRGIVALSPILDLTHLVAARPEKFNRNVTFPVFGKAPARLRRFSPAEALTAESPPILILVGERDYPYLIEQARRFAKERSASKRVRVTLVPEFSHEDMVLEINKRRDPVTWAVLSFIQEQQP